MLDFVVATSLIVAPFALGLGGSSPLAIWLSVATGVTVVILSLLTDYRFGLLRVVPYWLHLTIDGFVGAAFLAIPLLLGFQGIDALYYWINGAGVAFVVAFGLTRQPVQPAGLQAA